jgi:hypothetical protein
VWDVCGYGGKCWWGVGDVCVMCVDMVKNVGVVWVRCVGCVCVWWEMLVGCIDSGGAWRLGLPVLLRPPVGSLGCTGRVLRCSVTVRRAYTSAAGVLTLSADTPAQQRYRTGLATLLPLASPLF